MFALFEDEQLPHKNTAQAITADRRYTPTTRAISPVFALFEDEVTAVPLSSGSRWSPEVMLVHPLRGCKADCRHPNS